MLRGLLSAKLLAAGIAVVMMVTTVSIYAAGITGTAKAVGGTGTNTVGSPASAADVNTYTYDSNGNIGGLTVTWTPASNAIYQINVVLKDGSNTVIGSGSCVRASSGTSSRDDVLTISGTASPADLADAQVNIQQLASGSTTCG